MDFVYIIITSILSGIITTALLLAFFLYLIKKSHLAKNLLLQLSGMQEYLNNFRSIYNRLIEEKETIRDIIKSSIAKSEEETIGRIEQEYMELDQIIIEYIQQIEQFENSLKQ